MAIQGIEERMARRVALEMYDPPWLAWANDALWSGIRSALITRGIDAPDRLERGVTSAGFWRDRHLLLSQTCGYPFWTALRGEVQLVATPTYSAPGCDGPNYRSAILVRADDPARVLADCAGYRPAVNARDSQSGHNALRAAVAPLSRDRSFLAPGRATGAHLASMQAVAAGYADIAAVDCVTHALIADAMPDLDASLRRIAWSPPAPGLPFITAASTSTETLDALRAALHDVAEDPDFLEVRNALKLEGFVVLRDEAYAAVEVMEVASDAAGQPPLL
ncbi:MAG: PhnD/SsuA/transferrin family substrate-binding protein [Pseudomonadota bacterium]